MPQTITIQTGSEHYVENGDTGGIRTSVFGAEYLGWENQYNFNTRQEDVGAHHLRWPGGIPAEDGIDLNGDDIREVVYSLSNPNIMFWDRHDGTPRDGLSDVLKMANQHNMSFAMLLPTSRYVQDILDSIGTMEAVESREHVLGELYEEVSSFMQRLLNGDFGELPENFTFEIGSEYYATEVWRNNSGDGGYEDLPYEFGLVFATIAQAIADAESGSGRDFNIAVQLGRFQSEDDGSINLDGQSSDNTFFIQSFNDLDALDTIDALIYHRYGASFDTIDTGTMGSLSDRLETVINNWTNATGNTDLDLLVGWLSPSPGVDGEEMAYTSIEFGAPGLTSILQQFSILTASGMDTSTIFGLGYHQAGSLGTSWGSNGFEQGTLFIGGQLFGMMADILGGMHLLEGYHDNTAPTLDDQLVHDESINSYVFEDDSKAVVFLIAKDFNGETLEYTLNIDQIFSYGWTQRLWDPDGIDTNFNPNHIGVVGDMLNTGNIILTTSATGTGVSVVFQHSYEVIRLVLAKENPESGYLHLFGGETRDALNGGSSGDLLQGNGGWDTLNGNEGDDRLEGGGGRDELNGGLGNDWIFGGNGNDIINGGLGNDILEGGAGNDLFIISPDGGVDQISDFDITSDMLDLSSFFITQNSMVISDGEVTFSIKGPGTVEETTAYKMIITEASHSTFLTIQNNNGETVLSLELLGVTSSILLSKIFNGYDITQYSTSLIDPIDSIETILFYGDEESNFISGGSADNYIFGDGGHDFINGEGGHDYLFGGEGDDIMYGREGYDYLRGGSGDDTIYGGGQSDLLMGDDGDDTLIGGRGSDRMEGGKGLDVFVFYSSHGSSDYISDFNCAEDKIVVYGSDFNALHIEETRSGVSVSWGENCIILNNITTSELSDSDFVFI